LTIDDCLVETRAYPPIDKHCARVFNSRASTSTSQSPGHWPRWNTNVRLTLIYPFFFIALYSYGKGRVLFEVGLQETRPRRAEAGASTLRTSSIYLKNAADFHCPAWSICARVLPLLLRSWPRRKGAVHNEACHRLTRLCVPFSEILCPVAVWVWDLQPVQQLPQPVASMPSCHLRPGSRAIRQDGKELVPQSMDGTSGHPTLARADAPQHSVSSGSVLSSQQAET